MPSLPPACSHASSHNLSPLLSPQDSADKGKISEMRKLAQLRKAAEGARLQAKRLAAGDGRLKRARKRHVRRVTQCSGAAAASDSEHSLLDEDEFFVKS
jgi:hypothetical protein